MPAAEQPIITFESASEFAEWLDKNHVDHPGIWMRIYKKDSGITTITYAEALDEALCYGWIDGQKNKHCELSWLQKFTKRGNRSVWSEKNTQHIERLTKEGRMKPSGIATVDAARADGRWAQAYASSKTAEMPEDFLKALAKNQKAKAFYDTLKKSNRYAIYFRLQSAKKTETRLKRITDFIAKLERGEKLY